ncbi:membrane trafficking regulatory protein [Lithospermum erythrorhizon]|uniref:Membrane trafficking regulatory protein n=1 Tax=Lithospermum erythrorhizon TaxID=34254 RepID=A0AAV3PI08_LITER
MSYSDSETSSSSHGGEYKNFRQVTRERLLYEMLRSSKSDDAKSSWKVLIMDKVTVRVMSHSCKMADILDEGVSLVEELFKRREPLPSLDAIYYIQPSKENVVMFLSDMSGREPLYKKAYVYFSSPIPKELVARIKNDTSVLPRIGALREVKILNPPPNYSLVLNKVSTGKCLCYYPPVSLKTQMNLEYFPMDSQGYITDHERALQDLYGEGAVNSRKSEVCMNIMAARIATVFASLKEFPCVRYRAPKWGDSSAAKSFRELVSSKLAAAIWESVTKYKTSIPNFPQKETCELLILDRSIDQIAPVIHEWTYDAMCHDLLDLKGNKYTYEAPSKSGGKPEQKEVLLEDHDPVWLELRHSHIADASERLYEKMNHFKSKNKAAALQQKEGSEISVRDLQKMAQALPQYNETMEKLSIHVEIAGKINEIIRDEGLRDLGQLEQDLVFGDAGTKEVINYLRANADSSVEYRLRLMMIFAYVYPEKFEGDKALKLMQLAKLSADDMKAVKNMIMLEGSANKKATGGFSLKFDSVKKKNAARKDKVGEEETWQLFRFYPVLEELLEKLNKGELPKDEYQCMSEAPMSSRASTGATPSVPARTTNGATSVRSRRTATWARGHQSDDGYTSDSVLKSSASHDLKKMGQRIFVFIIGGATRSEMRVCHKLTNKLRREIVLGSTSIDDPPQYITKVKELTENAG